MENQVRIYRENPIAWWDKPVMRYLRTKYGKDKKKFVLIRSVYLALCEMESDFVGVPINSFSKTVGTYAGVSREVAGKYINLLMKENLITKVRTKDPKTKKYLAGTVIHLHSVQTDVTSPEPLSGYPSIGVPQRWDTRTPLKNISNDKKVSIDNNVRKKSKKQTRSQEEIEYYAALLADKLEDSKSLSFYKAVCTQHNPTVLLQKAAEIIKDGGARNPAAVFVDWLKRQKGPNQFERSSRTP